MTSELNAPDYPSVVDTSEATHNVTKPFSRSERERQDARFRELRAQGATYKTIAAEFGITVQAVAARYSRHPRRPKPVPGNCLTRPPHPPHIARWRGGVETICDGQTGVSQ